MWFITMIGLLITIIKIGYLEQPPIENRIVGGRSVSINQYPYHISLLFNGHHHCGAALINQTTAITGAHCITQPAEFYSIRAGSPNLNSGGVVVRVRRIILHPKYKLHSVDYDIAIVILNCCLRFGSSIAPIELPKGNRDPPVGTRAVVTGWGTTFPGKSSLSPRLQGVVVPIINQSICKQCYGFYSITDRMMCAGYLSGGKDACQGDSGGPLTANGRLLGIVSWGIDCAQPYYPGVYVRVSKVRSFIKRYTGL